MEVNQRIDNIVMQLNPKWDGHHVRLSWKGTGQRVHGNIMIRWTWTGTGTWYGLWSVRKQKWIMIIYLTFPS